MIKMMPVSKRKICTEDEHAASLNFHYASYEVPAIADKLGDLELATLNDEGDYDSMKEQFIAQYARKL